MAEGGIYLGIDQFQCSICLGVLSDPVTIPCGHNYCMKCISKCWEHDGVDTCPQCRKTFCPRPQLTSNFLLADMVSKIQTQTQKQQLISDVRDDSGELVPLCDVCSGEKEKIRATVSCLVCLASYCKTHIKPHYESPAFQKHQLVTAMGCLKDRICNKHDKLMEFYCRTDWTCICYMCLMIDHKDHDTVSAESERTSRQIHQFGAAKRNYVKRLKDQEAELQKMKRALEALKVPADARIESSKGTVSSVVESLKAWHAQLQVDLKAKERETVRDAQGIISSAAASLAKQKNGIAELDQLALTPDHVHFLQRFQKLCGDRNCDSAIDSAKKAMENIHKELVMNCDVMMDLFSKRAKALDSFLLVPKTRNDFLRYATHLALDPNTAQVELEVNEAQGSVKFTTEEVASGFLRWRRVLCKQGLQGGRYYWELGDLRANFEIAAAYLGVPRKDLLGTRDVFTWSIQVSENHRSFVCHSGVQREKLAHNFDRSIKADTKIGVFVDHPIGLLSFYVIQGPDGAMEHIHTLQTTFTEPLFPGFGLGPNGTLRLGKMEPAKPSSSTPKPL